MGVVYKAQDLKLDRFVALKFLPPHLTTSEEEKHPFIHEAQLVNYLVSTGKDIGLLINFDPEKVQIKRKIRLLE